MQVGLDCLTLGPLDLDPMGMLDKVVEYGLEGLQYFPWKLMELDEDQQQQWADKVKAEGLYLELVGGGVNPGKSGRSVDDLVDRWTKLFPLAQRMGATILNTCFGLYHERMLKSPTLEEQIQMTIQVLKRLAPMAADHGVTITMELHVDLTSKELARVVEEVDSPNVRACLDTANPLGLLEDPVQAARNLAPFVGSTHYKDTCVYLTEDGYNWQGGAPLGSGQVDLVTVTEILYEANPDIHLNIEDSWGFIPIPLFDPDFTNSFPDLTAADMADFYKYLEQGEALLRAGAHPRPEEVKDANRARIMPSRLWHNVAYAKWLRDDIVARKG